MKVLGQARRLLLWLAITIGLGACGGPEPPPGPGCVVGLETDCQDLLLDPPLYSRIFPGIIRPGCAVGAGNCHTADAAMGGLVLDDVDDAYDALLGKNGGPVHVLPHDPVCSPLMSRLTSTDPNFVMPKGSRLSDPALCDFVQWIARGATRD